MCLLNIYNKICLHITYPTSQKLAETTQMFPAPKLPQEPSQKGNGMIRRKNSSSPGSTILFCSGHLNNMWLRLAARRII